MKYQFKTTPERSRIMSKIRGKDTKIEVKLRLALWHLGIRYRKNYKKLPGSPDIALTKYRIAVFCDSDFSMVTIGTHGNARSNRTVITGSIR